MRRRMLAENGAEDRGDGAGLPRTRGAEDREMFAEEFRRYDHGWDGRVLVQRADARPILLPPRPREDAAEIVLCGRQQWIVEGRIGRDTALEDGAPIIAVIDLANNFQLDAAQLDTRGRGNIDGKAGHETEHGRIHGGDLHQLADARCFRPIQ